MLLGRALRWQPYQHRTHNQCNQKRRHRGYNWPDHEREEKPRTVVIWRHEERMNRGCDCQRQTSDTHCGADVDCGSTRCVAQSKVLVPNVSGVYTRTGQPRREPPRAHLIRWQCEKNADHTVQNTDKRHCTEPSMSISCIHDVWPTVKFDAATGNCAREKLADEKPAGFVRVQRFD